MTLGTVYGELGQTNEQIRIAELLIEKQEDRTNLSHVHALDSLLQARRARRL